MLGRAISDLLRRGQGNLRLRTKLLLSFVVPKVAGKGRDDPTMVGVAPVHREDEDGKVAVLRFVV